ncbi:glycosaminoglycan attachment site [Brasilonema sp. UFV-L1]|uniref:glycosaminoglycan attachment site n=1 Tax=Brasilonema sp. UFV-L1 TaxID=2234130 RepID=UPI00145DEF9F|nr:glycosaminoglycan attachment site [Brasilonema sp. UFV-L1]NMG08906.1 glycosaminoglycan attachment site [Brasilonema sp. UFV-L1]
MDLFKPIVPEEQQHPNFRFITQPQLCNPELEVIKGWADGFIDRDDKFVKEFQTTFNSSFWELYLFACFKELGCTVDFSYETPDFVVSSPYGEFIAEATTAHHPNGFRPEWEKNIELFEKTSKEDILRLATIRLSNAISSKYKKYISKYSKLSHVPNKPFVICAAPFEQPFFFSQDSLPIVRVLYAYEATLTVPGNQEGEIIIVGESRSFRVQKSPGVDIPLGLFTDSRMADVSAIIFNNRATFSKVRALAKEGSYPIIFSGARVVQAENVTGLRPFFEPRPNYQETVLDGLHILINPFAKHPLDLRMFENREVAIHNYDPQTDSYLSELPDGFLLQRMCQSIVSGENTVEFKRSLSEKPYQELSPEIWQESKLIYVGGQNGPFRDNHMAHYRRWTVVVSCDSIDEDWGAQAVNSLCYNIPQYMQANRDDSIASTGIPEWFPTKEEAYAAIRRKIDQISEQENTNMI